MFCVTGVSNKKGINEKERSRGWDEGGREVSATINVLTSTLFPQKAKAKGVTFVRVVIKGLGPGRQVSKWVTFVMTDNVEQHETVEKRKKSTNRYILSLHFFSCLLAAF